MRYIVKARIRTLLAQQSGHVQLLIFAPILTLFLLSLVVRTANSAIDPTLEKKKITQQLKQRLIEVRNVDGNPPSLVAQSREETQTVPAKNAEAKGASPATAKSEPVVVATPAKDSEEKNQISTELAREEWTITEHVPGDSLLLTGLANPIAATEKKTDNTQLSGSSKTFLSSQWKIAKNDLTLVFPLVKGTTSNKKKDEKPQGLKVPDVEVVKNELEGKTKKKEEEQIKLASRTSIPLPATPKLSTPVPLSVPSKPAIPVSPSATPKPERQEETEAIVFPEHLLLSIKKEETFEKILKRVGVPAKEVGQWTKVAGKHSEFLNLRPGQTLELFFSQDIENPGLKTVVYIPEEDLRLILERKTAKKIETSRFQPPAQPVWFVLGGRIEKGFSKSIKKLGLPEQMVKAIGTLEWGIDLSDLDSGDPFKILLEAVQRGKKIIEYKAVLAAEVINQGQTYTAFLLPEERQHQQKKRLEEEYKGIGLDIESEGQKFLRFPLEFSRISSHFSTSRFHPILHRARRHNGIDFAAPRGTPVYSVAKGYITFVGRQSGYGNIVKIDHPGPYETAYAHLQGFADGIEEGMEVEKGRVVGYVGSTGLATGPHLHFELLKDGSFVNPFERTDELTIVEAEEPEPVDPVLEAKKKTLTEKLATLEIGSNLKTSVVIPQQRGLAASGQQEDTQQRASSGENVQR